MSVFVFIFFFVLAVVTKNRSISKRPHDLTFDDLTKHCHVCFTDKQ